MVTDVFDQDAKFDHRPNVLLQFTWAVFNPTIPGLLRDSTQLSFNDVHKDELLKQQLKQHAKYSKKIVDVGFVETN